MIEANGNSENGPRPRIAPARRCPTSAESCKLREMRLTIRIPAALLAVAGLSAFTAPLFAQAHSTAAPTAGNGTYIATDPLANVRYDNRFDLSLGAAYARIMAGPTGLDVHGANLGGLDLSGSYWLSKHWAVEGSGRGYLGTSGVGSSVCTPNGLCNAGLNLVKGPFVSQYVFAAGPEWLGPHNKHGALIAHALIGGAYGNFDQDLRALSAQNVSFYPNQFGPAAIFGGHIDLNRSPQLVFRITPDALMTRYGINYGNKATFTNWNFGLSVGVEYKFKKKR